MEHHDWQPVYQELAAVIGDEATLKVFENFHGSTVTFPLRLMKREMLVKYVQADRIAGLSIHELAQRYQLAERTVRKYLQEK